jgi:hypothetical protein
LQEQGDVAGGWFHERVPFFRLIPLIRV